MTRRTLNTSLTLEIVLNDSHPKISRTVEVPSHISLIKLHQVIQTAMGWEDTHLYEFIVDEDRYGTVDPEWEQKASLIDIRRQRLELVLGDKKQFEYLYDFGDHWSHTLTVKTQSTLTSPLSHAICISGQNACPLEDCGGIPGYEHLLEVFSNPEDEDYDDMVTWCGPEFDPKHFDLNSTNTRLQKVKL